MNTETYYHNKKILIIGAASGIGRSVVNLLGRYGTDLYLSARSKTSLEACYGADSGYTYLEMDLMDSYGTEQILWSLKSRAGAIDIVINLAGHDVFREFRFLEDKEISDTFRVNFEAAAILVKKTADILFEKHGAVFVNINGFVGGKLSMPCFSIDSAVRAAVSNLFRSLRREYGKTGFKFVLFSPSGVNTETESRERGDVWKKSGIKLTEPDILFFRQFVDRNIV